MALKEKRKHSSELVPFSYYKCLIPDFFPCVPLHWHSEFELNYILDGSAEFLCGEERFITRKGDIVIIPPNMSHAIYTFGNSTQRYDTIVFSADMIGAHANDRSAAECIIPLMNSHSVIKPHITAEHPYYSEFKTITENIFSCAKGDSYKLDMLMKSELLRLFWLLEDNEDIHAAADCGSEYSSIRSSLEYINENFCENITVQQLADISHLSKSYFMSRFRQSAGVGAIEYINQLRIKKACRLLLESSMSMTETAFECGFRNISNFNRQFKKLVGCTPCEYRKHSGSANYSQASR